jgi:hypothetical protein
MPDSTGRNPEGTAREPRLPYSKEDEQLLTTLVQSYSPNWKTITRLFNNNSINVNNNNNNDKPAKQIRTRNGLQCKWRKMQADKKLAEESQTVSVFQKPELFQLTQSFSP